MDDVAAVLLVPGEGDPHGLLAEGPCGAAPPHAFRSYVKEDGGWEWIPGPTAFLPEEGALVLAWDGKVVPLGMDRLCRVGTACVPPENRKFWLSLSYTWKQALNYARLAETMGLGTIVLLDAEGREVT